MAAKFDSASTGSNSSGGTSLSWSHTIGGVGSTGLLIVGVEAETTGANVTVNGMTYNGVSLTFIGRSTATGGSHTCVVEMWALWGTSIPVAGSHTVSVSWTGGTPISLTGGAMSFFGIKGQAAEASNTASGNGGSSFSSSVTTVTNNALLVSVYGSQNVPGATSSTSDTRAFNSFPGSAEQSECDGFYRTVISPASSTVTVSTSNPESQGMILASFAISLAGGAGIFPAFM